MNLNGDNIEYRPLKIGYLTEVSNSSVTKVPAPSNSYIDSLLQNVNRYVSFNKRSVRTEDVIDDVNLIAVEYIRLFSELVDDNFNSRETKIDIIKQEHEVLSSLGAVQARVSSVISDKLLSLI